VHKRAIAVLVVMIVTFVLLPKAVQAARLYMVPVGLDVTSGCDLGPTASPDLQFGKTTWKSVVPWIDIGVIAAGAACSVIVTQINNWKAYDSNQDTTMSAAPGLYFKPSYLYIDGSQWGVRYGGVTYWRAVLMVTGYNTGTNDFAPQAYINGAWRFVDVSVSGIWRTRVHRQYLKMHLNHDIR